mmetsp:Transcript_37639/g.90765  ORF Transcript_37639/g.90765 Transcript_37639/m.90765 type:complete len:555 (-) Transcript_37639:42-1706(-)
MIRKRNIAGVRGRNRRSATSTLSSASAAKHNNLSIPALACIFVIIYLSFLGAVNKMSSNPVTIDSFAIDSFAIDSFALEQNDEESTPAVPPPMSKSLSILMAEVLNINRPVPDDESNPETFNLSTEKERCNQFDQLVYGNRTKRRRIFAGGLIADDSWHVLGATAMETYGIFHSVSFIESNRTQSFEPRKLRFTAGSKDLEMLQSGIYGPTSHTAVYVDQYVNEIKTQPMAREHMMREMILQKWKERGMTRDDIGIILDVDEIPSHDILRAAQICDPPDNNWRTTPDQTCRSPMIRLSYPMMEGSPKCVYKAPGKTEGPETPTKKLFKRFVSSAMVIGACVQGVGDSEKHPLAPREQKDSVTGEPSGSRKVGYGEKFNWSKMPHGKDGYFPLWNAADFRRMMSGIYVFGGVGFHLHNFFNSADEIRFKYAYFGHTHKNAFDVPLGALNADMNLFVKCAHDIDDTGNKKSRLKNGLDILGREYKLPAAFLIDGYVDARHDEMVKLVEEDEKEYGRADKFDGNHLYHVDHLTHSGRKNKVKVAAADDGEKKDGQKI